MFGTTTKPKRARGKKGRYKADDPRKKDYNEAYVGGKAPKKLLGLKKKANRLINNIIIVNRPPGNGNTWKSPISNHNNKLEKYFCCARYKPISL